MAVCFDHGWKAGFCVSASAPWQSPRMIGGVRKSMMKSLRRPVGQTASFAAWFVVIYSWVSRPIRCASPDMAKENCRAHSSKLGFVMRGLWSARPMVFCAITVHQSQYVVSTCSWCVRRISGRQHLWDRVQGNSQMERERRRTH